MDPGRPPGTLALRVRYAETDQMGRAHHTAHLVWCEAGRTSLMRERGVSYAEMERRGVLLPVSRVEVAYRRGVGFDETVRVETGVEEVRSRSVTFGYRIVLDVDGSLVATARTELVCTDREGRPRRLPEDVRELLEAAAGAGPR